MFYPVLRLPHYLNTTTGMTKVSRKALLDKHTLPDILSAASFDPPVPSGTGGNNNTGGDAKGGKKALPWNALPTFPMSPPKKWSREYFKNNIVSASDIEAAMNGKGETMSTTPTNGDLTMTVVVFVVLYAYHLLLISPRFLHIHHNHMNININNQSP